MLFFDVAIGDSARNANERTIYVHPDPPTHWIPAGLELQPDLSRAYRAAVSAFDAGQWVAVGVLVGRTLEGLLRHVLTDSGDDLPRRTDLGALLVAISESAKVDLGKPIKDLADVLRKGRNLAAHFSPDHQITREAAEELLDLLTALVEYLVLLPLRVDSLVDHLSREPEE
jgi:HEPN domain-containing protein